MADCMAINTAKYTRQPIPHFLNKTGGGNYLSFNQALAGDTLPESPG